MSPLTALIFLTMTTALVAISEALCQFPINCPCGFFGKNFTFCQIKILEHDDPCRKWLKCKICKDGMSFCPECLDGYFGPMCLNNSNEASVSKPKRIFRHRWHNFYTKYPELYGVVNDFVPVEIPSPCECENGGSCNEEEKCICRPGTVGTYCELFILDLCSDPGFISNGYRKNEDGSPSLYRRLYKKGESVFYSCKTPGFFLQGSNKITCTSQAIWSTPLPSCKAMCKDPGFVENGYRLDSSMTISEIAQEFKSGQSLFYSCLNGYVLYGSSIMVCRDSGQWSRRRPRCRPIKKTKPPITKITERPSFKMYCNDPRINRYGKRKIFASVISSNDEIKFPRGSYLEYSCKDGYNLIGDRFLYCQFNGTWSSTIPICQPNHRFNDSETDSDMYCDNPGPISNGLIVLLPAPIKPGSLGESVPETFQDEAFIHNTQLLYSCVEGYTIEGSSVLTCGADGFWSTDKPDCIKLLP